MKKNFILAAAAAAILGAGSVFGLTAQNSDQELSDVEVANIEALAGDEHWWEELEGYAKNCVEDEKDTCVRSPYEYHRFSTAVPPID